jgi:tetratricopeptide (TPR) repeat protein
MPTTKSRVAKSRIAKSAARVQASATRWTVHEKSGHSPLQTADKPAAANPARLRLLLCALIIAATCVVYIRAAGNPFVNFDDQPYVTENSQVQQGLTRATFRWSLTTFDAGNWHPLTWISHAIDCQLYGLNPTGHHVTSILLHALNAGMLFLLLAWATGRTGRSLVVALLFALHPINVESVAWVSERKTVLSMFFFLLALAAYGWYARKPKVTRYLLVALLFALALTAKPMVVTFPFALLLLDFWPLRRVQSQTPSATFPAPQYRLGWLVLEKIPLLLLSIASSVVTMMAQRGAIAQNEALPLLPRIGNAIYAYSAYLAKCFWPAHLASFYPYEGERLNGWQFFSALFVLACFSYLAWRFRGRTYPAVGWLWFLGTLVPMIGIVQVGTQSMADRYAYLPLIGIFCAVVWGVTDFAGSQHFSVRSLAYGTAAILLLLSALTWRQIGVWHSSYDLWAHALKVTRDNFMAENYVGSAILLQTYEATGQRFSDEAFAHFQNAARINPNDPISHLNIGAYLHEHGQLREAAEQYQIVQQLTADPHLLSKSLTDLGAVDEQLGDYPAARDAYLRSLKFEPGNRTIFMNLGKLGMEERIQELTAAASHIPSPNTYFQLGQLQQSVGRASDAKNSFQAALKLDPSFARARDALNRIGQ